MLGQETFECVSINLTFSYSSVKAVMRKYKTSLHNNIQDCDTFLYFMTFIMTRLFASILPFFPKKCKRSEIPPCARYIEVGTRTTRHIHK